MICDVLAGLSNKTIGCIWAGIVVTTESRLAPLARLLLDCTSFRRCMRRFVCNRLSRPAMTRWHC